MLNLRKITYLFSALLIFTIFFLISFYSQSNLKLSTNAVRNKIIQQNITLTSTIKTQNHIFTKKLLDFNETSLSDNSQLVNLHDFQFLHLAECSKNNKYPILLIAIHSAPHNEEKRKVIRETWGMENPNIRLVFMIGVPEKQEESNIIAAEHDKYKDIVQGNFKDTYKNLTYKHVMVLKYAVYHCPNITYLLKTDDDVFINTPTLLSILPNNNNDNIVKPHELLCCLPMIWSPAIREKSKWFVSFEEFPDEFYPPYCSGYAELFSKDTVTRIYQAAQISKFLWVDDVFVTGISRIAAKIKITPFPTSLRLQYSEMNTLFKINNTYPNMIYPFLLGPINIDHNGIRNLWNLIINRKVQ